MRLWSYFIVVFLALGAGYAGSKIGTDKIVAAAQEETTFDRVMKTNTVRCGYYIWAPFMMKDANTGEFSGLFYDMITAIADNAGLKIDWAEEIGLGEFPAALQTGRVDAYCTPLAQVASRARAVDFTDSIGYFPIYAFVKTGDTRFDGDLSKINNPDVRISTIDGEMSALLAANIFSKAKTVQLPQNASSADLLNNVVTGKADVVLNEYATINKFLETNPDTLAAVQNAGPVGVFGGGFAIAQGQEKFRRMLNWSIRELLYMGRIKSIYEQHNVTGQTVLMPANPY